MAKRQADSVKPDKDRRDPDKRGANAFETARPAEIGMLGADVVEIPDNELIAEALRRRQELVLKIEKLETGIETRPSAGIDLENLETLEDAGGTSGDGGLQMGKVTIPLRPASQWKVDPSLSAIVFKYNPSMPKPAVVALLEQDMERGNRATAAVVHGFLYHAPDGQTIKVPIGYITDFASIPALLRWLIAPFGRHARAAILHDWLYAVGEKGKRGYADQIAFDALKDLGVGFLLRWAIFLGVRVGGWMGYGKQKEWDRSWADWKTGDAVRPPKHARDKFWNGSWPNDPDLGH